MGDVVEGNGDMKLKIVGIHFGGIAWFVSWHLHRFRGALPEVRSINCGFALWNGARRSAVAAWTFTRKFG